MARTYDLLNTVLWLPGGSSHLRKQLVGALDVRPGMRVLELGCGTGLVTRHLVDAGASVTAVDGSESMLNRARARAPGAEFSNLDLTRSLEAVGDGFDRVVLSFILHELDPLARQRLLRDAADRLHPDGFAGVLEWSLPTQETRRKVWRAVVRTIEPDVAHDVLDGGIDIAILGAGLQATSAIPVAGGRASIVLIQR